MSEALRIAIQRAASDEVVRTCLSGPSDGGGADAAVDFDIDVMATSFDHRPDLRHLGFHRGDVWLPAEAGVDSHDQDHVEQIQHMHDLGGRCRWIERHCRAGTELANMAQRAMQMVARLGMDDQHLAASLDIQVREFVRLFDHEVSFERPVGPVANRGDDVGSERKVGHETAIHDIELETIDTGLVEGDDLVAEAAEVSGKNRWDDGEWPR